MPSADAALRPHFLWQLSRCALHLGTRTRLMGIVNVTPDSFSDDGAYAQPERATDHALRLLDEGADILDIGGESTRPGSPAATTTAIAETEEQARVLPVIEGILRLRPDAVLSIDTYRASTAKRAVESGAQIVNDVSGLLWDGAMAGTVATLRCGLVLMHTRGKPSEWQHQPALGSALLPMLLRDLQRSITDADQAGVSREQIVIDPGFGFGKKGDENWSLLRHLEQCAQLGRPLLVGLSRKGFLAPDQEPWERDATTHAAGVEAVRKGAHLLRVHDVQGARRALDAAGLA